MINLLTIILQEKRNYQPMEETVAFLSIFTSDFSMRNSFSESVKNKESETENNTCQIRPPDLQGSL